MRILVGMSGGLDSTYAAMKLIDEGHEVEGAVLVMHRYTDTTGARATAESIGIPLHVIDCTEDFSAVEENFIYEYKNARTPNPCIICNQLVKFRRLADFALENGFDRIATGHYAGVAEITDGTETRFTLVKAKDERKDQTYMLYRLPQDVLSILVLPLSDDVKTDVRAQAERIGLEVAHKKESQEICFIPDGDYATYIEDRVGRMPEGDFIDTDGKPLGKHKGIIRYTVGQRKGLGISLGERVFVSRIDAKSNTVMLSGEPAQSDRIEVDNIVFTGLSETQAPCERRVSVKLRYQALAVPAIAIFHGEGRATLLLDSQVASVTPGQSAVMYDKDLLLAGGFIV